MTFGSRVHAAVRERGPLCAGIDPHAALLHEWGLDDSVAGLERFALGRDRGAGRRVRGREAAVGVLRAVRQPRRRRPRAGHRRPPATPARWCCSTSSAATSARPAQAYAEAYLDPASPLAADAITVSPFLGFGSLDPFVDTARKHDAGLFVLARTSNKEAPEVQARPHRRRPLGRRGTILDHLRALNAGAEPLGSFGAVVGATIGDTGEDFAINGPLLAPGYGAQGGTAADLPRIFGAALPAVLPSSSRELLRVGPDARGHARRRPADERRAARAAGD